MRLQIIQHFINAADAVLGHNLRCSARVDELTMDTRAYKKHGVAATVELHGDIEGRIVLDMAADTARKMAREMCGDESDPMVDEVVCEMANQVIGNAVTVLNDCGYHFRVQPPQITRADQVPMTTNDIEALVMRFETDSGPVFMNIALRTAREFAAD